MAEVLRNFLLEEQGSSVIEYALIIAVISVTLVLALQPVLVSGDIGNFISRLSNCLNGSGCQ